MKKILNWTFGGFFRALGRVLCFLAIGTIVALIIANNDIKLPDILSLGIMKVKAEEITYTGQFRIQYYSLSTGTTALTTVGNFDTTQQLSSGYGVSKIIPRYYGITFKKDTKYRVTTIVGFAPTTVVDSFTVIDSVGCFGTLSSSNWSADSTLIKNCEIIKIERVPNNNRVQYTVDITPKRDIPGIQFNINASITEEVRAVNVYTASSISVTENLVGAIEEQTETLTNIINQNNEDLINAITEQNQVCKDIVIKKNTSGNMSGALASNCGSTSSSSSLITDYLELNNNSTVVGLRSGASYCFYDSTKTPIGTKTGTSASTITIPTNAKFIRFQISNTSYEYANVHSCKNAGQATNDLINDSDSSEATNEASDFFNNFTTNTHGLTSIVTAPLNAISSLTSSSCTPLHLPIPYLDNKYIDLPCMRSIYDQNFGSFMSLYDTITFGIVSYWIIVRIFALVKDFKNPEHDEIEVVDL